MKFRPIYISLSLCVLLLSACRKDFLNQKPDKALLVPSTMADFQALLDNNQVFNISPGLTAIADGDFFTTDAGWKGYFTNAERNSYTWSQQIFGSELPSDWNVPYQQVFYANVVLDGIGQMPSGQSPPLTINAIKGTALFYRAFAFYNLVQQFAAPYQDGVAQSLSGIPLRLHADVTQKVQRATLQQTYAQILSDLQSARNLLPVQVGYKSRPGLASAFAMLSRVYLAMADYNRAGKYADSCLVLSPSLINYNTLSQTATRPFPRALPNGNDEVIFYSTEVSYSFSSSSSPTQVDSALYQSYTANDLRKVLLYRAVAGETARFKGNYAGIISIFSGIATDEIYFDRAECKARLGDAAGAMGDLNTVLSKRWKTGSFVPFTAIDAVAALKLVLSERRKELAGRNLRWVDLRRLNADQNFSTTLKRRVLGITYTIESGSKRYVYPIPQDEVNLSGINQNER